MNTRTHAFKAAALALALILTSAFMVVLPSPSAFGDAAKEASKSYDHSASETQNGVTFNVQWSDSTDKITTFHVTATGGSGDYKARMDVPTYWDGGEQESVCDPSRNSWINYATFSDGDAGTDFQFEFTASGTYRMHFYFMNKPKGVTYLRTTVAVTIDDPDRPSVSQIVNEAVAQCKKETNGSEYEMALWLHDWTIGQLEYDRSLNYCSAESGLTRSLGTCESYQRIYAKLLNAAGIASKRMEGNGHTWNAVKIDDAWYQMDLTWDDSDNSKYYGFDAKHLYFGLTDELMAIAHPDHKQAYENDRYDAKSTSLASNYYVRHGEAIEWAKNYVDQIQKKLDAKEESFTVDAKSANPETGTPLPPSIANIQNGIIAYALSNMTWRTNGWDANVTVTYDDSANSEQGTFVFAVAYKKEEASSPSTPTRPGATEPEPSEPGNSSKPSAPESKPGDSGMSTTKPANKPSTAPAAKQLKSQNLTIKTKTKTIKKSKFKKKARTMSGCIKVSGAKGVLSYSKISGSSKLSINKGNGKITVKKKTKKGTYRIKVKVNAAASPTKGYRATSKTVAISIKMR